MTDNDTLPPFEVAYRRLEEILEAMNSGTIPLDDALALYEEADRLIVHCSKRLSDAEARIETLMKSREGALELDGSGRPRTQTLATP